MSDHSKLSPSSADRWTTCTASLSETEDLITAGLIEEDDTKSYYSTVGTQKHEEVATELLKHDYLPLITTKSDNIDVMNISNYLKNLDILPNYLEDTNLIVEKRVTIPLKTDIDVFGTPDLILKTTHGLIILDHKFGAGVPVDATKNLQLTLYAYGYFESLEGQERAFYGNKDITLIIYSPNTYTDEIFKSYTLTHEEMNERVDWINTKVLPSIKTGGTYHPSPSNCLFCKARYHCKARAGQVTRIRDLRVTNNKFDDYILEHGDEIIKFIKNRKEVIKNNMINGDIIKGYALKETKGRVTWKPEATNRLKLDFGNDALVMKPITQTEFKKRYKEKFKSKKDMEAYLSHLTETSSGGFKIVKGKNDDDIRELTLDDEFLEC